MKVCSKCDTDVVASPEITACHALVTKGRPTSERTDGGAHGPDGRAFWRQPCVEGAIFGDLL